MRRLGLAAVLACLCASLAFAGGFGGGFGKRGFSGGGVVTVGTPLIEPLMASMVIPAATGNHWFTPIGAGNSGATSAAATRGIPVPVPTVISGLEANVPAAATAGVMNDYFINSSNAGAAGTVTCSLASAASCSDTSHSDTLAAGDTLSVEFSASAAWTSGNAQYALLSTPTDGVSGFMGSVVSVGSLTTTSYVGMGIGLAQNATSNSTEVDASSIIPVGITVTGLFLDPNATQGTPVDTVAICKNGTCTGTMSCTLTTASSVGCCVNTTSAGHVPRSTNSCGSAASIHFAAGDTISLQFTCSTPGSCATMNAGVSVSYVPDTAGQAILTSQPFSNTTATSFAAMHDWEILTTQSTWNMLPYMGGKTAHFANMIACTDTNPGSAGNSRTFTSQLGSGPGVAPTTVAGATAVVLGNGGGACTGGSSGFLLGGGQDTSDTWTATPGQTVDYTQTIQGSPVTANHTYKLSQTVVIQ